MTSVNTHRPHCNPERRTNPQDLNNSIKTAKTKSHILRINNLKIETLIINEREKFRKKKREFTSNWRILELRFQLLKS